MKKIYFILAGGLVVLLLLAIWVYLLIYGTPKPVENFFTDFSFSGNNENTEILPVIPVSPEVIIDTQFAKLRQLTTKPVIGMGEYTESDSSPTQMRYAEAGTGHVFSINLETGAEMRLSNITITNATRAIFSPDGRYAVIASGFGQSSTLTLLTLNNENNAIKEDLIPKVLDIAFTADNELLYTEYSPSGQTGKSLSLDTKVSRQIFTLPFQSAHIIWGDGQNRQLYVYSKTTAKLPGYLYKIENNTLLRQTASGLGLSAEIGSRYLVHTISTDSGPVSYATNLSTKKTKVLPIVVEPSKCVFSSLDTDFLYCGHEQTSLTYDFPDNWYKGLINFKDTIWEINMNNGLSAQLVKPVNETGREIDITDMQISNSRGMLYFVNKNDNTLWVYEI